MKQQQQGARPSPGLAPLLACPWCGLLAPSRSGRWLVCSVCGCSWQLSREVLSWLDTLRSRGRAA